MKNLKKTKFFFLLLPCLLMLLANMVPAQKKATSKELVKLKYFNNNNTVQYLILEDLLKTGNKTEPQQNKLFQLFLDSNKAENLIAKVKTNNRGKAKAFIPPTLKNLWDATPKHTFIAVAPAINKEEDAKTYEIEITKARITLDTVSDIAKTILVSVSSFNGTHWVPANNVEMKVGVSRTGGGILSAGDKETYTTDSSGMITVAFTKDSLPGDTKGNMVMVAKVEENELYGNLLVAKVVPWGVAVKTDNSFFDQRTLWSTRFKTPFWLLFVAYSIVIGVWGTIIYLVFQIVKIKKLGIASSQ